VFYVNLQKPVLWFPVCIGTLVSPKIQIMNYYYWHFSIPFVCSMKAVVILFVLCLIVRSTFGQTCPFCEYVVATVEQLVENNATESEILQWLEKACALLPTGYSQQCMQAVAQDGPQVIQWIVDNESPEKICQQLSLCPSDEPVVEEPKSIIDLLRLQDDTTCTICQFVAVTVEKYIANNATQAEIEEGLDQLCSNLPIISGECDSFVEQYLPQLIAWIQQDQPPKAFCVEVGLCTTVG